MGGEKMEREEEQICKVNAVKTREEERGEQVKTEE